MEEIICPACGASNPVESTVCESCGEDLSTIRSVMDSANKHYNEALALAHAGRLDEAIGQLEAALALSGQNPQFHNLLGTLYAQKEDYEGAIEAWERALTLDPEMEKAYRNIEKAQGMLEEEEVEEERRPFLLVAIALGIVALLCAGAAFYFGSKAYSMKESIADMNTQLENQTNETLAAQKEIQEMRTKQDAVLAQIPGGSFDNLVSKMQELQTQAAQQQSQVSQLTAQRQTEGNALRAQIAQLQQEKARLQDELKRVASLENQVRTEQARVRQLERSLEEKDTQIAQEQQRANDLKSKVALAEETNRSIKSDRDRAISNLTKSNERKVEELRNQILELRGQIAAYENTGNNREQANRLIVEALKNLDSSKFELAQENLSQALTLAPEHTAAAYLQDMVQGILNDPVEQQLRRKSLANREQNRQSERERLIQDSLQQAQSLQQNGQYDEAIRLAEQVLALEPEDARQTQTSRQIIQNARENKHAVDLLMLEARRNLEAKNYREAQSAINQILNRAPMHAEARELQRQLTQ